MNHKHRLIHANPESNGMEQLLELLNQIKLQPVDDDNELIPTDWGNLIKHQKSYDRFPSVALDFSDRKGQTRYSLRNFDPEIKVDLSLVTNLLNNLEDHSDTDYPKRAYPSAGAFYSVNIYGIIRNTSNFQEGLYFFQPKLHSLQLILAGNLDSDVNDIICDNNINLPSILFILTTSYYKPCIKYGARGFFYSLIEAGSVATTLNQNCLKNDLACVWLGGFNEDAAKKLLDLSDDLEVEKPILLVAVGKPYK